MFHVIWGRKPGFKRGLSDDLNLAQTRERHIFFDFLGVDTQPKVIGKEFESALLHILKFFWILISYWHPEQSNVV